MSETLPARQQTTQSESHFHAFTSFGQSNRITGSMMSAGRDLALWHLYESQRFFNELAVSPEEANAIKSIDAWIDDSMP